MSDNDAIPQPRRQLLISYLAAAAVGTHLLEAALPGLGPWFKPGLANTFTLVAFFRLGWQAAAGVALIRVLVGSIALGTFLSPTFFLSVSGAMGAVLTLGLLSGRSSCTAEPSAQRRVLGGFGVVGVSLLASMAHISCQVLCAWFLIIGHAGIFLALPWFLLGAWATGIINGLLAFLILERLARFTLLGEKR
ncbi:MAG: Gx transporter family protein [Magnetococcales bacterium]|nr:Gx transporter family protein [Magnetococcales bacterium]